MSGEREEGEKGGGRREGEAKDLAIFLISLRFSYSVPLEREGRGNSCRRGKGGGIRSFLFLPRLLSLAMHFERRRRERGKQRGGERGGGKRRELVGNSALPSRNFR